MVIPDLLTMADARSEMRITDLELFNYGLESEAPLRFFVIVPERGACQVPQKALSHFQAGARDYTAQGLRLHWSGDPVGEFAISRDALLIYADDWNKRMLGWAELAQALEGITVRLQLGFLPVEEVANAIARAVLSINGDPAERFQNDVLNPQAVRYHGELSGWLSRIWNLSRDGELTLRDAQGLDFSGPFEEAYLSSAELAANAALFTIPKDEHRTFALRIFFELHSPGRELRTVVEGDGSTTTGWFPKAATVIDEAKESPPGAAVETRDERNQRWLAELRSTGGTVVRKNGGTKDDWVITSRSGAVKSIADREGFSGKTVSTGIKQAAEREDETRAEGIHNRKPNWSDALMVRDGKKVR